MKVSILWRIFESLASTYKRAQVPMTLGGNETMQQDGLVYYINLNDVDGHRFVYDSEGKLIRAEVCKGNTTIVLPLRPKKEV